MRSENYASSSELVRNLADLRMAYQVLETVGNFRIVKMDAPFFDGYEYWVVNEKGFLWEGSDSLTGAQAYLETEEAKEYQQG